MVVRTSKKKADIAVSRSRLDWLILRPSLLTDDPAEGTSRLDPLSSMVRYLVLTSRRSPLNCFTNRVLASSTLEPCQAEMLFEPVCAQD